MIAGSLSYRAHEEREAGFLHLFEEQCPTRRTWSALREGHDDAEKNYRQARALFEQHGDLAGIYNIGGGAEGIGRAIHEAGAGAQAGLHRPRPDARHAGAADRRHAGRGDHAEPPKLRAINDLAAPGRVSFRAQPRRTIVAAV
jgi:hypothetical protein